jgi:DNA-binding response OmpR family regulator
MTTPSLGALLVQQFRTGGWLVRHLEHPRDLDAALAADVPDLLVLDELLPSKRGSEVLVQLRQSHPHLPVLMLSALGGARHRVAGLEAGANDYLGKPFLFRELQLRVNGAASTQTGTLHAPDLAPGGAAARSPAALAGNGRRCWPGTLTGGCGPAAVAVQQGR